MCHKVGICMVLGAYWPEISGGAIQCFNLMESLRENFNFYVISTFKVSSKQQYTEKFFTEENIDKTKVFRINLYHPGKVISEIISSLAIFIIFFKLLNKVHIFHMHGYTRKSYLLTLLAKIFRKKIILKTTSFGVDDPLSIKKRSLILSRLHSLIDAYVVTSPAQQESYKKTGLPEKKVFFIPNGVNLKKFNIPSFQEKLNLRKEMHISETLDVILCVSFFSKDKGLDIFAESLLLLPKEKLNNIFLIFIGSRDYRENEIDREVIKKVYNIINRLTLRTRTLFIDSTLEIEKYFKVSNIFILPSKREGLPNALLEAMASGLCCIANRINGITDYIIDSPESGYLLNTLNPDSLAAILNKVIGNKNIQNKFSYKAHLRIEHEFDMDKIKSRYIELYTKLLLKWNPLGLKSEDPCP